MLVSVLSLKGSPGVTTFAVALAARWPGPARVLVVEADPSGGDLSVRFGLASTPGLVSLAAAARRGGDADLVWRHTQRLPGGLPVIAAPPDAEQARAALSALVCDPTCGPGVLRVAANQPGTVIVVDCGRVDPGSPVPQVARSCDAVVLLSHAHAEDLAHLSRRLPVVGRWSPHPVLLLAGDGYPGGEVAREIGVTPLGRIPHDPNGAAVLCGRPTRPRRWRHNPTRSALGRYAHQVAIGLAECSYSSASLPRQVRPPYPPAPLTALDAVPGIPPAAVSPYGLRPLPSPVPDQHDHPGGCAS